MVSVYGVYWTPLTLVNTDSVLTASTFCTWVIILSFQRLGWYCENELSREGRIHHKPTMLRIWGKKQGYAISIGGEGGMRAALSYVTTEEQSASGRVCSLSPTELSWPPETSCFELLLSTSPDAVFFLWVKWLLIVPSWNIQRNFKLKWANSTKVLFV